MIFTEKYKPKCFKEIIGLDKSIPKLVEQKPLPDFLFHGPAGTGKSSCADVIVKTIDGQVLWLNASDESGIETMRGKIKRFAMSKSILDKRRVIIFEEADGLSPNAYDILRGIMDKYGSNCSFIFTLNKIYKIPDPLKSRCVTLEFKVSPKEDIKNRLVHICKQEGIEFTEEGINNIITATYPDIRSAIKDLETIFRKSGTINDETTNLLKSKIKTIIDCLKGKDFKGAIKVYVDEWIDEEILIAGIADEFFYGNYMMDVKKKIMSLCRTVCFQMSCVKTKRVVLRPFLLEVMESL